MRSQGKRRRFHQTLDRSLCWRVVSLLDATKERRNAGNGNDCASPVFSFLLGHLIGNSPCDEKRSVEVDLLRLEEQLVGHIQECMEWTNASVRHEHVDSSESSHCFVDYLQFAAVRWRELTSQSPLVSAHLCGSLHIGDVAWYQDGPTSGGFHFSLHSVHVPLRLSAQMMKNQVCSVSSSS